MNTWVWRILKWGVISAVLFAVSLAVYMKVNYVGYRHDSPFLEAHERAIQSFVDSAGFGSSRMRRKEYWNDWSVNIEEETYEVLRVQLIGATEEEGLRYFESTREPPGKEKVSKTPHRALTAREEVIISQLRQRKEPFVIEVVSEDQVIDLAGMRVIAPMFARESCLKCHDAEIGDLLGAFDYRLSKVED